MSKPKITKEMRNAGIIKIGSRNFNGSYVCDVRLKKVDLQNTVNNPRTHSPTHGNKIAKDYFEECVRNPILQYRRGKLVSIDGRHTSFMLLEINEDIVMTCNIHFNITNKKAARIFHDLTKNNKKISPWDAHACALRAEMKHALDIQRMIDKYNLSTPNSPGFNSSTADITGYHVLSEAWNSKNGVLDKLLYILSHCYAYQTGVDDLAKSSGFVRGLLSFISSDYYITWTKEEICELLIRRTASEVTEIANDYASEKLVRTDRSHFCDAFDYVMTLPYRQRRAA